MSWYRQSINERTLCIRCNDNKDNFLNIKQIRKMYLITSSQVKKSKIPSFYRWYGTLYLIDDVNKLANKLLPTDKRRAIYLRHSDKAMQIIAKRNLITTRINKIIGDVKIISEKIYADIEIYEHEGFGELLNKYSHNTDMSISTASTNLYGNLLVEHKKQEYRKKR